MATDDDYTPEQKQEAMAAAAAYFKQIASEANLPQSAEWAGVSKNFLIRLFYADAYLHGRAVERGRGSELRVAAKVMLKVFERSAFDQATMQRLMPGILSLRAAIKNTYANTDNETRWVDALCERCGAESFEQTGPSVAYCNGCRRRIIGGERLHDGARA